MRTLALIASISLAGCSLYIDGDDPPGPSDDEEETPVAVPSTPPTSCGAPEVHVIGVYETRSDHGPVDHPRGDGSVDLQRPGAHVVVLSAYEPTRWKVSAGSGATIEAIYAIGYHGQEIDAPPGVPIVIESYDQGGASACGYSWPYNGGGCDTNQLLAWTAANAGTVTSFQGCYRATRWILDEAGVASDCATDAGYQVDSFAAACGS